METSGRGIFKFRRTDAKKTLMSNTPSVKSSDFSLTSVPAFWPMAMGAAMFEEGRELYAKNIKFVDEEIKKFTTT